MESDKFSEQKRINKNAKHLNQLKYLKIFFDLQQSIYNLIIINYSVIIN